MAENVPLRAIINGRLISVPEMLIQISIGGINYG